MSDRAGAESELVVSPNMLHGKQDHFGNSAKPSATPLSASNAAPLTPALTDKRGAVLPELFNTGDDNTGKPLPRGTPFFSAACWKAAIPILVTPLLYGYNIGLVGPYSTIYGFATNCQLYGAQTSCETLSAAKCAWMNASTVNASSTLGMVCGWQAPHTTCFLSYNDELSCGADSDCAWSYSAGTCGNRVGYSSILSGLFAGSMIMGSTVGSLAGGVLARWLDYRKTFLLIGLLSLIGDILTHVATGIFQYWLLFVGRIVLGVGTGWQAVATPHYTDKFAPVEHAKTLGSFFQCGASFGIFIAAVFGIIMGNTISYDADSNQNLMGRMQGLVAPSTLLSVLVMFLPLMTKDGYSLSKTAQYEDADTKDSGSSAKKKTYGFTAMIGPILNGVAMGCICQLTGINANMNFAPSIMGNLGIEPLVGNIIVMAWNSAATFCVIPLSRRFSMRTLFLFCGFVGSLCCVFLSGIPVYPGVTKSEKAVNGIAITGIAIFIALYEMGVGPCFFVLAVDVFPESFRPIGSSITVGVMMAFNLVINICYPIATEGISGGPSGDQNKGQSIAFMFFGGVGLVTFVIEYLFLSPWEKRERTEEKRESGSNEPLEDSLPALAISNNSTCSDTSKRFCACDSNCYYCHHLKCLCFSVSLLPLNSHACGVATDYRLADAPLPLRGCLSCLCGLWTSSWSPDEGRKAGCGVLLCRLLCGGARRECPLPPLWRSSSTMTTPVTYYCCKRIAFVIISLWAFQSSSSVFPFQHA